MTKKINKLSTVCLLTTVNISDTLESSTDIPIRLNYIVLSHHTMKSAPFVALIVAIVFIILGSVTTQTSYVSYAAEFCPFLELPATTSPLTKTVKKAPETILNPALRPVCGCESSWEGTAWGQPRQYNPDGTLRRGYENASDIGYCQINTDIHGDRLRKLNLDVTTQEDNIRFANLLFSEQGYQPWEWSRKCWQDHI